ncbi:unnamed protein product, partial [marine sediment metagenome]
EENKEIPKKVDKIKKIVKKYGVKVSFPLQMGDISVLNKKKNLKDYSCHIFKGYNFTVYNDCKIHFCPFIALEGSFDSSKHNPKEIVNCEPYKKLRIAFKKSGALPICRRCCSLKKK